VYDQKSFFGREIFNAHSKEEQEKVKADPARQAEFPGPERRE
jgi:hypothetical protein